MNICAFYFDKKVTCNIFIIINFQIEKKRQQQKSVYYFILNILHSFCCSNNKIIYIFTYICKQYE